MPENRVMFASQAQLDAYRKMFGDGVSADFSWRPLDPHVYDTAHPQADTRCQQCGKLFKEPSECRVHAVVAKLVNKQTAAGAGTIGDIERSKDAWKATYKLQTQLIVDNPSTVGKICGITE